MTLGVVPAHTQVLVIGGGPAGSYTASVLARDGIDVVLLDLSKFPRYHIGESLLPSVRHYLRFIGAEQKIHDHGFARKPGSAIKFNQYRREGYTDFVALGSNNSSWNVVRSEFDALLLDHARESGASVFTHTKVETLDFSDTSSSPPPSPTADSFWPFASRSRSNSQGGPSGRPVKASYVDTTTGQRGEITFDYVVDASGRNGILSTRYLKNRRFNQSLKNVAVWGYWRNAGMYGKGTNRENAPFFEALSDESGWAWFIPLHNGLTSVGVVMEQKQLGIRSRAASSAAASSPAPPLTTFATNPEEERCVSLADKYLTFLHLAPGVQALIGEDAVLERVRDDAEENEGKEPPFARSASDFSYSADRYAGPGWRIVGDAGAFIDPFFSSGVHLAMTGAVSAAATIAASLRGDCDERDAAAFHTQRIAMSYTRFLVVVLSAYKQIRAQSSNVLADIDEDGFDKAFAFFRPVIQGGADMGKKLSEDEVQRALDFCVHLFSPTTPEQHESVRQWLTEATTADEHEDEASIAAKEDQGLNLRADHLLDVKSPVIDPLALARLLKARLSLGNVFRRSQSSPAVVVTCSDAGESEPSSPVSAVFSFISGSGESGSRKRSNTTTTTATTASVSPEEKEGGDEEIRMVLDKVNARRVIHSEHGEGLNSLEQEAVGGMVIRLVRGRLGLVRC